MITIFHNVEIAIESESPECAYAELCGLFQIMIDDSNRLEYTTDTFSTDNNDDALDTTYLMGK